MNRRQFLKQTVATCIAAVAAPTVLAKDRTGWENDVGGQWPDGAVRGGKITNGIDCNAPGRWENYYKDWPPLDPTMIQKFEVTFRSHKPNYPLV